MNRNINFLLVDDDHDDRFLFEMALTSVESLVNCYTASNGKEALELLHTMTIIPDVIFLDINMPIVNGWEFFENLKKTESYNSIPIIIYSTSSHERDVNLAKQLGAFAFCTKPDDLKDLKQILESVIDNIRKNTLKEALSSGEKIKCLKPL